MQTIKLNLIPGSVLPVVNVSQYDVKRQFALQVYDGASTYDLTGKTVEIRGTKPDGNGFAYDAQDGVVSVSGNTVTISTTQQMTAVGGHVMTELRITSGQTILGTLNFIIDVENSALSDDTPISETEIPVIERLAWEQVEQAEAWARGTKGGVPVSSDEPQYEDNSYYWSQVAAQYAAGGLHFMGSVAFASIPTTGMVNGDMYNITDDFTTDSRFIEGAGVEVKAGANIAYIAGNINKWDILATGGGGADALGDLTDVDLTSPADGDLLQYDATGQKWENSAKIPQKVTGLQQTGCVNRYNPTTDSRVVLGVTFTKNDDNTYTLSGTATAEMAVDLNSTIYADYLSKCKLVGCPSGGSSSGYYLRARLQSNGSETFVNYNDYGSGILLSNAIGVNAVVLQIVIKSGVDVTGVVIKPMITPDLSATYADYQPYSMTNRELTEVVTGFSTNGWISFYRVGKVCTCKILANAVTLAAGGTVGNIPDEFLPVTDALQMIEVVSMRMLSISKNNKTITTNHAYSNVNIRATQTWVCE